MKKVVFITTRGGAKKDFVNSLQQETGTVVSIVIQEFLTKSLRHRLRTFFRKLPFYLWPQEILNFFRCQLPYNKQVLLWAKTRSPVINHHKEYLSPIKVVTDINSDEVYNFIKKLCPDIIVIWGGQIIKKRVLDIAETCINIHNGVAPSYRGSACNGRAILNDDWNKVGITIHYAVSQVDSGNIIEIIKATHQQSPRDFFRELNDKAFIAYKKIVKLLIKGEDLPVFEQNLDLGKIYTLKSWTNIKQMNYINKLKSWQRHAAQ